MDSQARCSAGGSGGHFWSDRYELWGCVSAKAEKEGAALGPSTSCRVLRDDGQLSCLSRLGLPKVGLPHC